VRTLSTENPGRDVRRYLKHWSNPAFVEERLVGHHAGLKADQRRRKAREVAVCIQQGLEYIETSDASSLTTKPLPLFYAIENFAKGVCVFADPSLHADDFRAHGLSHDPSKRYSLKNLVATVQRPGKDVWSRFLRLGNTVRSVIDVHFDTDPQTVDVEVTFSPRVSHGKRLRLGALVRALPELIDDLKYAGWETSFVVHVPTYRFDLFSGPPESISRRVMVRHRHDAPTKALVLKAAPVKLRGYSIARDHLDVVEFRSPRSTADVEAPSLVPDLFGELYIDFNTGHVDLAEPLVYYAILFILSSAVRYEPEQWQRLLDDHPAEGILVERMLDVATRKIPNLILNKLEGQLVQFKVAR
jgi:hypothetical protein